MGEQRKIIHLDADCFYAAVEMRDNPAFVGQPLAVGGQADRRGVIATCNYEARAFGVRSAMSTSHALRLCPHLIVVPPDFARYKAASQAIFAIYRHYTDKIEPLSLDEAYLDVSNSLLHGGIATQIAAEIRQRVKSELNLTVSAGVAPNKFLAKIASDWRKPDGLFVIRPHQVERFIATLPIERLFGVGPKTAARLHQLNIQTCTDLRGHDVTFLAQHFGKFGHQLHQLARGIDHRSVHTNYQRKSISVETTFLHDLNGFATCQAELPPLLDDLQRRIDKAQARAAVHKLFIKIKLANFTVRSMEHTCAVVALEHFEHLLRSICVRHPAPIRLLGVGVRLSEKNSVMNTLFD
ncbi:MAG: DNA polymerase IV [Formosimonas sp.]